MHLNCILSCRSSIKSCCCRGRFLMKVLFFVILCVPSSQIAGTLSESRTRVIRGRGRWREEKKPTPLSPSPLSRFSHQFLTISANYYLGACSWLFETLLLLFVSVARRTKQLYCTWPRDRKTKLLLCPTVLVAKNMNASQQAQRGRY